MFEKFSTIFWMLLPFLGVAVVLLIVLLLINHVIRNRRTRNSAGEDHWSQIPEYDDDDDEDDIDEPDEDEEDEEDDEEEIPGFIPEPEEEDEDEEIPNSLEDEEEDDEEEYIPDFFEDEEEEKEYDTPDLFEDEEEEKEYDTPDLFEDEEEFKVPEPVKLMPKTVVIQVTNLNPSRPLDLSNGVAKAFPHRIFDLQSGGELTGDSTSWKVYAGQELAISLGFKVTGFGVIVNFLPLDTDYLRFEAPLINLGEFVQKGFAPLVKVTVTKNANILKHGSLGELRIG